MLVATISGGGANVVMVPILILTYGLSPGAAIGTAFLALIVGSVAAAIRFFKKGQLNVKNGVILGLAFIPGSVLGSLISFLSEGISLEIPLGVIVIGLAVMMVVRDRQGSLPKGNALVNGDKRPRMGLASILLTSIGVFVGFSGQGGGLILIPVLRYAGFSIVAALGMARLVAIIGGGAIFFSRLALSQVDLLYGLALAVGTTAGGFLGVEMSSKLKGGSLRLVTAILIGALGVALTLSPFW